MRQSVHVSEAQVSSASRRAVSHGDAVVVEQVRQPLLPGAAPGIPLKQRHEHAKTNRLSLCAVRLKPLTEPSGPRSAYRELLYDLLQQVGVGQQLAVERDVLQQRAQDPAQLRQLVLAQVGQLQRLQQHPQQAGDGGERRHAGSPYGLPGERDAERSGEAGHKGPIHFH